MEGEGGSPSDRRAVLRPVAEGGGATRLNFLHASIITVLVMLHMLDTINIQ